MTDKTVSVIQKPRYVVLLIPVAWLLFSIWILVNEALPRYTLSDIPRNPPSGSEIFNVVVYALGTTFVLTKILHSVRNHIRVSAELKSGFAFLLGSTVLAIRAVFSNWEILGYVGFVILDIAAIIMIVTLLQGKPFGPLTLYHKEVQIQRNSA